MRLPLVAATLLVAASTVAAQQPPESLALPNSAQVTVPPDTVTVPDSLRFYALPELESGPRAHVVTGVWLFEREELLARRGLSLAALLAELPGIIRLRGGDHGAPETVTAFGLGGGSIRVFWDGFELIPLDASVVDLGRVGLGGVERVRVERHPGELRIELASLRDRDPRPSSLIEAGTGDLDTNFFQGTFVHPRALGGSLGLTLDRIDTNGPNGEEGTRTGGWLRYTRHWNDDLALTAEARRTKARADVPEYPGEGSRTDWVLRGRWRPVEGLVLQGYTGRSALEGLQFEGRLPVDRRRRQHGLTADLARGPVRAHAAVRAFDGPDVPAHAVDLSVTSELPLLGGASAFLSREWWNGDIVTRTRLGAWTRPLAGFSLFGSRESGARGVVVYPLPPAVPEPPAEGGELEAPEPEPAPAHRRSERTALRLGVAFDWGGVQLSAARVAVEPDRLPLLGLPMDRSGLELSRTARDGMELAARIPLPVLFDGLALTGSLLVWDEGVPYLPRRSYQAALVFHDVFLESGNFELWVSLGVEGRDPMQVPLPDPESPMPEGEDPLPIVVPFYQSWHGFIQARVLAVRLWIGWENFTARRNNQDYPGRVLPIYRTSYGVRWNLWN